MPCPVLFFRHERHPGFSRNGNQLPPKGTIEQDQAVRGAGANSSMEVKEWQAIMEYLKTLPKKNNSEVRSLVMDERVKENRSIDLHA